MGGPMDMIFGVLLETFLKLLKSITLQFFLKYIKSSNNLNVKNAYNSTVVKKRMDSLGATKLRGVNRT